MLWLLVATAYAGKRALAKAALGVVALPGGVVIENGAPWGLPAAGELGRPGTEVMQAVHAVARDCFADRLTVDPLSGEPTGWHVVVDVAAGPEPMLGAPLVDGIVADAELACLAEGLATVTSPVGTVGMTVRIASAGPVQQVGAALVTLDTPYERGDTPEARRATRFERRASELALACARSVGAPEPGTYVGAGSVILGVPDAFAACWEERAATLDPWVDVGARFRLRYLR